MIACLKQGLLGLHAHVSLNELEAAAWRFNNNGERLALQNVARNYAKAIGVTQAIIYRTMDFTTLEIITISEGTAP